MGFSVWTKMNSSECALDSRQTAAHIELATWKVTRLDTLFIP